MELLGEWVMWNLVSVRLETVLVSVQYRCTVCAERTIGSEIILDRPTILIGDEAQAEACLSPLVTVLFLLQDRSVVCVERTIGKEIILDAPNGTPWGVRHVESRFGAI
jgi:hypothetical protein